MRPSPARARGRGVQLAVGMATGATTVQVTMPQMGESVTEGTVLEWRKQQGEPVQEGEPLVEVSSDKVDAEVPAPASGVLTKVLVEADQTAAVGAVLAEIEVGDPPPEPPDRADGGVPEGEPLDVACRQMGVSVSEGTVIDWRVPVGDRVEGDQPLVEVSTDKVDAEVPAPVAGTVS